MNPKKRTTNTTETQHNRMMFGKWFLLIVAGVFIVIVGAFLILPLIRRLKASISAVKPNGYTRTIKLLRLNEVPF